jgi:SAM-dependent methyltransferase
LLYSHLALARLLTGYDFDTVLEIGSRNGTAARALEFAGKRVLSCEIINSFDAIFSGDYFDLKLDAPVDAIWCSHVLEHQRHVGRFLEKMFDDLSDNGVLAVTVPSALSP